MVDITPPENRTITKKIDLCNYNKNYEEDKDKWDVDYDRDVVRFFDAIEDEKEFVDNRENPVSMGGDGHVEFEDQYGNLILLSNDDFDATDKDDLYVDHLQRKIKGKKYNNKNTLREILKVAM